MWHKFQVEIDREFQKKLYKLQNGIKMGKIYRRDIKEWGAFSMAYVIIDFGGCNGLYKISCTAEFNKCILHLLLTS